MATGVVDVATNNTEGLVFAGRETEGKKMVSKVKIIWRSPLLPESAIIARKDLDPVVLQKLRTFFLDYGKADGPEGDRERKVMAGLTYRGFAPADNSYLDSVRAMIDANALREAKTSGDPAKIATAQKAFDALQAELAIKTPANAPVSAAPPAAKSQ